MLETGHAKRIIGVPLDIMYTRNTLFDNIEHISFTSRALQHARSLMLFHLAGHCKLPLYCRFNFTFNCH